MLQVGTGTPSYVCDGAPGSNGTNGTNGTDGQSVTVTAEPIGANCAYGGQKLRVGSASPTYVCNGAPGATGATGADGQSVTVTSEPAGSHCTYGGQAIQVGSGTPSYVCNGGTGIVSTVAIDGQLLNQVWTPNTWILYGPTATVTVAPGQRITASISASLHPSASTYISSAICYSSGGAATLASTWYNVQFFQGGQWAPASWDASKLLPAGTYTVGFCAFTGTTGQFDIIDVSGFVQVMN